MRTVVVIGGGASGLFAAIGAAEKGNKVYLFEKNEKLGKKIYITGKGRCNLTNNADIQEFLKNVVRNPKFLYTSMNVLSVEKTLSFFKTNGLPVKTERGNRVFPVSDKASDVTKTLEKICIKNRVNIFLNKKVTDIIVKDGVVKGIKTKEGLFHCDSVIVCTGGISYSKTGSDGDGYKFAEKTGHTVIPLKPALCGIEIKENFCSGLQGLSLKNVVLSAHYKGKTVFSEFGEMLFTHYGISGPIVLSCSSMINRSEISKITLLLDLKPALSNEILDKRFIRDFSDGRLKSVSTILISALPKSLIPIILEISGIPSWKKCSEITSCERKNLVYTIKNLKMNIKNLRPIEEAIITSGGVDVKQINPKTMESKIVKGLFFAGEVVDIDSYTGGFNLQTAFSTGYLAGLNS